MRSWRAETIGHRSSSPIASGLIDDHAPLATRSGASRGDLTDDGIYLTALGSLAIARTTLAALAPDTVQR